MVSAQQKEELHKGLLPSSSKLINYDYVDSFDKDAKDNLALLIQQFHVSLMAFHNNDSTLKSRAIINLDGKDMPIESLVDYKQSEVDKIEIEFLPQKNLTALYGSSALNGYGIIKILLKKGK